MQNAICTTCVIVDCLTIQDKTKKGCTLKQNLTTTVIKLIKINTKNFS